MAIPPFVIPRRLHLPLFFASIVVVIAGLRAAAPILTPLALAAFIAAISFPALSWLRNQGAPTALAILLIVLIDAAILSFIGWVVFHTVNELRTELPEYVSRAQDLEFVGRNKLLSWGVEIAPDYYSNLVQPQRLFDLAAIAARNVTSALSSLFLIILYLVFILAESVALPEKAKAAFGENGKGLQAVTSVLKQVQRYLGLKTVVSLTTGLIIWGGAELVGVDFAVFWGLLAFVLNYIPTIGSIIAAVPAILLGLLQLGWGAAAALSVLYLAVNVIIGSIADPILVGRTLRISPIIVLISLMFWGWVWGPVGMFLSVPLTIILKITLENSESGTKFADLMGPSEEATRIKLPRWRGEP